MTAAERRTKSTAKHAVLTGSHGSAATATPNRTGSVVLVGQTQDEAEANARRWLARTDGRAERLITDIFQTLRQPRLAFSLGGSRLHRVSLQDAAARLEPRADSPRQHLAEASAARLERAILDRRGEIQPIAGARQRDVQADAWFPRAPGPSRLRRPPIRSRRSTPTACRSRRPARGSARAARRCRGCMFTTNTIGNSRPLAACTVIRLTASMRVDDGVRFVADGEIVEKVGDPRPASRSRGSRLSGSARAASSGFRAPARAAGPRISNAYAVSRRISLKQLRRRHAVDHREPARQSRARTRSSTPRSSSSSRSSSAGGSASAKRVREASPERARWPFREPDDPRAQERRGTQIRRRIGEKPQQRDRDPGFRRPRKSPVLCRRRSARGADRARLRSRDGCRATETARRCRRRRTGRAMPVRDPGRRRRRRQEASRSRPRRGPPWPRRLARRET